MMSQNRKSCDMESHLQHQPPPPFCGNLLIRTPIPPSSPIYLTAPTAQNNPYTHYFDLCGRSDIPLWSYTTVLQYCMINCVKTISQATWLVLYWWGIQISVYDWSKSLQSRECQTNRQVIAIKVDVLSNLQNKLSEHHSNRTLTYWSFDSPSSDHSNRTQPQHSHHNNHPLPLPFPIIKQIRNPYPINPLHHSGVEQQSPDKERVCDTKIVTEILQMLLKLFQWTHQDH